MRFVLTFALFLAASLATFSAQTHDAAQGTTGDDFHTSVEKETFQLVNEYRKEHAFPELEWSDSIAKVAREHSTDMATGAVDFGHDGFRDRVKRLRDVMTGFAGVGENVLMTSDLNGVAKTAVALWLKSPHHLENIRGDYNYSGLGVWQDKDGTMYFTQIFMKFKPQTEEAKAAPSTPGMVTPFWLLAPGNTRARP